MMMTDSEYLHYNVYLAVDVYFAVQGIPLQRILCWLVF